MNRKSKANPPCRLFSKTGTVENYRECPNCRQNELPFKKGICPKCSHQIGDIQYVKDPKEYVKSNYGNVKMKEIREVHQESDE